MILLPVSTSHTDTVPPWQPLTTCREGDTVNRTSCGNIFTIFAGTITPQMSAMPLYTGATLLGSGFGVDMGVALHAPCQLMGTAYQTPKGDLLHPSPHCH